MQNGYFTLVATKYAYHVFINCIDIESLQKISIVHEKELSLQYRK